MLLIAKMLCGSLRRVRFYFSYLDCCCGYLVLLCVRRVFDALALRPTTIAANIKTITSTTSLPREPNPELFLLIMATTTSSSTAALRRFGQNGGIGVVRWFWRFSNWTDIANGCTGHRQTITTFTAFEAFERLLPLTPLYGVLFSACSILSLHFAYYLYFVTWSVVVSVVLSVVAICCTCIS